MNSDDIRDKNKDPINPAGGAGKSIKTKKDKGSEEARDTNLKKYDFHSLLKEMIEINASDLHLTVGIPPTVRIDGSLKPLPEYAKLSVETTQSLVYSALTDKQIKEFEQKNELDLAVGVIGLSRFRPKFRGN